MSYVQNLEEKIKDRSDELEETHLDAAIDAQVSVVGGKGSNSNPIFSVTSTLATKSDDKKIDEPTHNVTNSCNLDKDDQPKSGTQEETSDVIFDDYSNPNSVHNCLSPYVPSSSARIKAFVETTELHNGDVLLDIGCGDGRVCIASAKMADCKVIGLDVSPPCIAMAKEVASEEGVGDGQCSFYELDATIDPDLLLSDECPIRKQLESATVIFLYTYPTLLVKLIPLLARLTDGNHKVRQIVTLTYHLPEDKVVSAGENKEFDFHFYSKVFPIEKI